MGKKTAASAAEAEPSAKREESSVSLSRAIREALKEEGVDAQVGDIEAWIKKNYPKLTFSRQTLSSTLSTQRKKMREDMGLLPSKTGRDTLRGQPTFDDMMRVKNLAESRGGISELSSLVERVEEIASQVGGVAKLKSSLEALKKLTS